MPLTEPGTVPSRRVRKGHRLVARLLVLVLAPVAALGLQAGRTATARSRTASQAEQVEKRGDALIAVIRVGFALSGERVPVVAQLRAGDIGLTPAVAARLLGFDPSRWVQDARDTTNAAMAALPTDTRLQTVQELITRARQDSDRDGVSELTDTRLLDAQNSAQAQAQQLAAELARQTEGLAGSSSASRDVLALQLAYQASLLQSGLAEGLFSISVNETRHQAGGSAGGGVAPAAARAQLAQEQANYRALATEIDTMGSGPVRAAWHRILDAPATVQLDEKIADALVAPSSTEINGATLLSAASLFRQSLERSRAHYDLVQIASDAVLDDVRTMRTSADLAYRSALQQAGFVAILALLGALFLSRGVTRPLHEIAARAHQLRDGDLSFDPAANKGPREVVAVGEAFNDVVSNLRLLEEQATALSDGDTQHESLQRAVPPASSGARCRPRWRGCRSRSRPARSWSPSCGTRPPTTGSPAC